MQISALYLIYSLVARETGALKFLDYTVANIAIGWNLSAKGSST